MAASLFWVFAGLCMLGGTYAGYGASSGSGSSTVPKKYRITSLVAPPYLNAPDEDGNLTGIIVDILNSFKVSGPFDYEINLSETLLYGDVFPNGSANGMIEEIRTGVADIAAGALIQTRNRSLAVDFTEFLYSSIYRIAVNKDYNPATAQYITINSTSVQTYLQRNTLNPLVVKIWASIQSNPDNNIVTSYEEGVNRVAAGGNVAFVADTPFLTAEQQKQKDKVFFTGDNLSVVYFSMAVKIDSPLRALLNDKILEFKENGSKDVIGTKLPSVCLS